MIWWPIISEFINKAGGTLMSFFSLFLLGRNSKLSKENELLKLQTQEKDRIITIQNKVLDAAYSNVSVDLDDNLERMRQNKL